MRLCHPEDTVISLTASDRVLQAVCHAPQCGRRYATVFFRKEPLEVLIDEHLSSSVWAIFSSVERMVNEMRCAHHKFCSSCQFGNSLDECKGIAHA